MLLDIASKNNLLFNYTEPTELCFDNLGYQCLELKFHIDIFSIKNEFIPFKNFENLRLIEILCLLPYCKSFKFELFSAGGFVTQTISFGR